MFVNDVTVGPIAINMSMQPRMGGGVLKFGFGRDVPPWILKTHTNTIRPILRQILSKIIRCFLNLSQFKFGKILKKWPIHVAYQSLHFIRGHSYTKRLILLCMLAAHPGRVFCTEYPALGMQRRWKLILYLTTKHRPIMVFMNTLNTHPTCPTLVVLHYIKVDLYE